VLILCRPDTSAYMLDSKTRNTYCHMPYNVGSYLPTQEGSDAATCLTALDHTSLLRRVPTLSHISWLRICLPAREVSSAATCPVASDPVSLLRMAPTLSHVLWIRILPPCSGGLRCCHVSSSTGPASMLGRAPALSRVPWLFVGRRPQE
jgi:hypothetical protein